MNNKILSIVLVAGIATTGFTAISSASETETGSVAGKFEHREITDEQKAEMLEKGFTMHAVSEDGERVHFKGKGKRKGKAGHGKRGGFGHLTDDEKTQLESMSDEDKKAFFEEKKEEMKAKREAHKTLIDTLIAGETLSSEQETLRSEMLEKISNSEGKFGKRDSAEIIEKLLKGEALTSEEQETLTAIHEKHAERDAQRELMKPIFEKVKAGEELTSEEQTILDEAKENRPERKAKKQSDIEMLNEYK